MTSYRKTSAINLVARIVLIPLGAGGRVSFTFANFDANLFGETAFAAVLILVGGYEIGKYAEMHHQLRKNGK